MKSIKEGEVTCDLLRSTLERAEREAMDRMGYVHSHLGERGTGQCELRCDGPGCKKRIKAIYTAPKISRGNPYGPGTVSGYDLINAKETIQTNNVPCAFEE
jgi:hypothetical protein